MKQKETLINEQNNIVIPEMFQRKKFNFFQKIFSKKYKIYLTAKEENIKLREQGFKMDEQLRDKISNIQKSITEKKIQISGYDKSIITEKIITLSTINNIPHYMVNEYPDLAYNLEFMKEAIMISIDNIKFDKTNNQELYVKFIDICMENKVNINEQDFNSMLKKLQQEIIAPKQVEIEKYKIPSNYIYEFIRNSFYSQSPLENIYNKTELYFKLDGKLPDTYGKTLQSMWEDEKFIFAVHGVNRNYEASDEHNMFPMKIVESIFANGLKATNSTHELSYKKANPQLYATACCQTEKDFSFLDSLDYGYASSFGFIIMQIPKSGLGKDATTAIWGLTEETDYRIGKSFLLPEYIKGFVENNKFIDFADYKFIKNNLVKREYPYLLMDFSYSGCGEAFINENKKLIVK